VNLTPNARFTTSAVSRILRFGPKAHKLAVDLPGSEPLVLSPIEVAEDVTDRELST
jgi:hypothetical protein